MKLTAVPEVKIVIVEPHPVPSVAIPREVVTIPLSCAMENVGVLLPSRFTVNAATWEVPDRQLAIIVPAPGAGAFCTLRVEQFWCVANVRDGTVTAGKS